MGRLTGTAGSDEAAVAALDIGTNSLVTVSTFSGKQRLYHGRPPFTQFRRTTEQIAAWRSELEFGTWSSRRIRRLFHEWTTRVSHLQDGIIRDLAAWPTDRGVGELIASNFTDVLAAYWSVEVNEKIGVTAASATASRRCCTESTASQSRSSPICT